MEFPEFAVGILNKYFLQKGGRKIKEIHVADFIQKNFKDYVIRFDKKIDGGCSKRRPDILIDLGTHIIIIEIDENGHRGYNISCEIVRINEIFTDLGDRPIIFIRFNPEGYRNNFNEKIESCFEYNKFGVPSVKNKKTWYSRLHTLYEKINYHSNNIPVDTVTEYLYFDGFN